MTQPFWGRVLDYRYDAFCCDARTARPLPPAYWPRLLPTTRVWLAAIWSACRG